MLKLIPSALLILILSLNAPFASAGVGPMSFNEPSLEKITQDSLVCLAGLGLAGAATVALVERASVARKSRRVLSFIQHTISEFGVQRGIARLSKLANQKIGLTTGATVSATAGMTLIALCLQTTADSQQILNEPFIALKENQTFIELSALGGTDAALAATEVLATGGTHAEAIAVFYELGRERNQAAAK